MRIVQLANAYGPSSGGLRTAVNALGRGYIAAGHERVLVVPGTGHTSQETEDGLIITLPSTPVGGGYRMITRFDAVREVLEGLTPDSIEVSDKATLTAAGRWARSRRVGAVLISHERLDAVAAARFPTIWRLGSRALTPAMRYWNRRLASGFDTIVTASAFAQAEFAGLDADVRRIPLGVDLETFRPRAVSAPSSALRSGPIRLILVSRLSPEKNPSAPIAAVRHLIRDGFDVHLDVYGEGAARSRLELAAADLPVTFHGHLSDRAELARHLADADIAFAPGPAETFGLAVLEALACGTPVIAADRGGSPNCSPRNRSGRPSAPCRDGPGCQGDHDVAGT